MPSHENASFHSLTDNINIFQHNHPELKRGRVWVACNNFEYHLRNKTFIYESDAEGPRGDDGGDESGGVSVLDEPESPEPGPPPNRLLS